MTVVHDCDALESLPLKLLIVAVVAALSVAPAMDALEDMRDKTFLSRATAQLDRIANTAEVLSVEGPGAARTLSLDFSSSGSLRMFALTVGDECGGDAMMCAVLRLNSGASLVRYADDPPAWLCDPCGEELVVYTEVFELSLRAVFEEDALRIVAEVV